MEAILKGLLTYRQQGASEVLQEENGTDFRLGGWGHTEEGPDGNHREELIVHDSSKEKLI